MTTKLCTSVEELNEFISEIPDIIFGPTDTITKGDLTYIKKMYCHEYGVITGTVQITRDNIPVFNMIYNGNVPSSISNKIRQGIFKDNGMGKNLLSNFTSKAVTGTCFKPYTYECTKSGSLHGFSILETMTQIDEKFVETKVYEMEYHGGIIR